MMNTDGEIRQFMTNEEAGLAGFDTPLDKKEARVLKKIEKDKRHKNLKLLRGSKKFGKKYFNKGDDNEKI